MAKTWVLTVFYSDGSLLKTEEFSSRKEALAEAKAEMARGKRYGYKRTYQIGTW